VTGRCGCSPGVFVPRPQTEELARRAAGALGRLGSVGLAADLCTGAGAVGVYLQSVVPGAGVVGVDIDRRAVTCARRNGLRVVQGDLGAPLRSRAFHVVTAVAPYVPSGALRYLPADVVRHEPPVALDGGADGLDAVRGVVEAAGRLLAPGGWLLVEVGGDQDEALLPALEVAGFGPPVTWRDEDGDLRGLEAELLAGP
jgi:release factor glutamine methyltransferase